MLGHLGCCQGYYCPRLIISNQYVKLPERRSLTKNSRPVPIVIYHTDSVISKQINSSSQNSPIIPEPLGIDICDTYRVGKTKQKIKAKKYRWSYPSLPTGTSNKPTPIPSAIAGLHVSPSATVNQQTNCKIFTLIHQSADKFKFAMYSKYINYSTFSNRSNAIQTSLYN